MMKSIVPGRASKIALLAAGTFFGCLGVYLAARSLAVSPNPPVPTRTLAPTAAPVVTAVPSNRASTPDPGTRLPRPTWTEVPFTYATPLPESTPDLPAAEDLDFTTFWSRFVQW